MTNTLKPQDRWRQLADTSGEAMTSDGLREAADLCDKLEHAFNAMAKIVDGIEAERDRYRGALEYYAYKAFAQLLDHRGKRIAIDVTADWGYKARAALEKK